MSRPLRIQYPGAVYHVTCRGNERKEIFQGDEDRTTFLDILRHSQSSYRVKIYAWVLMGNHFHLLLETPLGNLDQFMRRFNITYTSYVNRKYERVGHLYQGRYKSLLVEKENYLSALSRYIHLNPIRTKAMEDKGPSEKMKFLSTFRWSTLKGYLDQKKKLDWVDYTSILSDFGGDHPAARRAYRRRLEEDVSGKLELSERSLGGSIIGEEGFIDWVKETFLKTGLDREHSGFRELRGYKAKEEIMKAISIESGQTREELLASKGDLRRLAMELLYRIGGLKGTEIGKLFGVSYNAVSQERKRLAMKAAENPELRRQRDRLVKRLGQ